MVLYNHGLRRNRRMMTLVKFYLENPDVEIDYRDGETVEIVLNSQDVLDTDFSLTMTKVQVARLLDGFEKGGY